MIKDPKIGDVVSLADKCFHEHLSSDKMYVITAIDSTWARNLRVSLTTAEVLRNEHGRKKHLGSWSGVFLHLLQRNDFLTAVYNAKKEKNATRTTEETTPETADA